MIVLKKVRIKEGQLQISVKEYEWDSDLIHVAEDCIYKAMCGVYKGMVKVVRFAKDFLDIHEEYFQKECDKILKRS